MYPPSNSSAFPCNSRFLFITFLGLDPAAQVGLERWNEGHAQAFNMGVCVSRMFFAGGLQVVTIQAVSVEPVGCQQRGKYCF